MAETMQFDLVSPERSLASFDATEVQIPGAEGDMTAMADHAPTLTTLRPGVLSAVSGEGTHEFLVTGGFAEITPSGVTILAERAVAKADVKQGDIDALMAEAQSAVENATDGAADSAQKNLADITAVASELGLSAA